MSTPRSFASLLPVLLLMSAPALAADAGVPGKKLVITEKTNGDSSVVLTLVKDDGIQKGGGVARNEPEGLDGSLEIFFTDAPSSVHGAFQMPAEFWLKNGEKSARFVKKDAGFNPVGEVFAATIKNGKLASVTTKGQTATDGMFDLSVGLPSDDGGITTVLTIINTSDGSIHRMCTKWAVAEGSKLTPKTKKKATLLTATKGVATECPPLVETPAECEILNGVECLLPYPSSRFLVPADTPTGYAVRLPQAGIPQVNGPEIPASLFDDLDGFSPGSQILMHFPQGVDVETSNVSRLLEPECCSQPAGPPWIDTRTYTGRSLDPDSPTVLLDADTGERVLHFVENDGRPHDPARELFFLRPAVILTPGHRYIVAVRNLLAPGAVPVKPELPFRLLRDGVITEVPAIEARRAHFDTDIFPVLETAGVERDDLILAFDFVVGSEETLSGGIRSMRDQAYAWLDTVEADPEAVPFTVTDIQTNDCDQPGTVVWRTITGTYQVPLFLTGPIDNDTTPVTNLDANGVPLQSGFHDARMVATLPCSARDGEPTQAVLMGHGLFQDAPYFPTVIPPIVNQVIPWTGIAISTDWRGLSSLDLGWLGEHIIGLTGQSELHHFPAFPARLRQGMVNTLVLARLMKSGILNRDPAFQREGGAGVLPGPTDPLYYFGVSLGGIMGTYLAGLTPDIDNFVLDVGAVNFSCMLPRATPFKPFFGLLNTVGLTDSMTTWLGVQLTHELWASAEPVSVVHHVTSDPYPGSGNAKHILYTAAWLDHQVSNTCTEIAARTMGLPVLEGSYQQGLQGMPDVAGPVDSALVFHHLGQLDILNPAHAAYIPPLTNDTATDPCDPHGTPKASTPTTIRQNIDFLLTGQAKNFCTDLCDGEEPDEVPLLPAECPVAQ